MIKTKEEVIKVIDTFHSDTDRSKFDTIQELEAIQEHISDLCAALQEEIDQDDDEGDSDEDEDTDIGDPDSDED